MKLKIKINIRIETLKFKIKLEINKLLTVKNLKTYKIKMKNNKISNGTLRRMNITDELLFMQ